MRPCEAGDESNEMRRSTLFVWEPDCDSSEALEAVFKVRCVTMGKSTRAAEPGTSYK